MTAVPKASDADIFKDLQALLAPFNRHGVAITPETRFVDDLALDSLAVMELVASVEDHFDITVPINRLPDIPTVGVLAGTVGELRR